MHDTFTMAQVVGVSSLEDVIVKATTSILWHNVSKDVKVCGHCNVCIRMYQVANVCFHRHLFVVSIKFKAVLYL